MKKTGSPIFWAVFGRCPRCGIAPLFSGYLKVATSCTACGLDYSGHDAADGPVVPIMLIVGFFVAGGALWLEFNFHPAVWIHMAIWVPVIFLLSLALMRPFKALFIGTQFKYRADKDEFPNNYS